MGDLSPAFDTEEGVKALADYYSGIGLYGFNAGQKSFGLNINGRAFFGKSGKGQILIDGNSGTIQSQHFLASMKKFYNDEENEPTDVKKAGMRIDLDNGILETYGLESTSMIKIDPSAGGKDGKEGTGAYFVVRSSAGDNSDSTDELDQETETTNKKGTEIFYAGKKKYFLQSHNYRKKTISIPAEKTNNEDGDFPEETVEYGRGINFDLMKGKLNAFNFTLTATDASTGAYVKLNSENTNSGHPYFVIHGVKKDDSGNVTHVNNLLYFSNKIQRMRSLDYNTHDETGTEINLANGKITSYDFNLKAIRKNQGIQMSSSGKPFLLIRAREDPDDEESASKTLVYITNTKGADNKAQFYLQSKNYSSKSGSEAGVKIDLGNNKITAYDFNITAYHPYTDKDGKPQRYTLRINSGADTIPLQVGTRFKVHWDGKVEADYIEANSGRIAGWYLISQPGLDRGIYSYDPTDPNQHGIQLLAKGEIRVGHITTSSVAYYMVLDTKTNTFKRQNNKPDNFDELEKQGNAYAVYQQSAANKIGFVVTSAGQVTANGAQLNSAKILEATLTNCTIQSAKVGALTGGSITGATINGSTITGGTIKGGNIDGGTIKGAKITGGSIDVSGNIKCGGLQVGSDTLTAETIEFEHVGHKSGSYVCLNRSQSLSADSGETGSGGASSPTVGGWIKDSTGKGCSFSLYISVPAHTHSIPSRSVTVGGDYTYFLRKKVRMRVLGSDWSSSVIS